jgi:L-asparaginase/Glu-tRNA(Gln) amidotransferase subunit D
MTSNDNEISGKAKEIPKKIKPKISLILTGGTIGAKKDLIDNVIFEVTERYLYNTILNDLLKNEIECDLKLSKTEIYKLSENMVPSDWEIIARSIVSEIDKGAEGIVVTHGTDTLAYSTSAISFMLGPVPIPIVFTGAFYPLNEDHSDALKNIRNSILFSLNSSMPGIFVLFSNQKNNGYVFRGAQITSVLPYGISFSNPNFRPLASFESDPFDISYISKCTQILSARNSCDIKYGIDPNVAHFKVHPGFNPRMIDMALRNGAKGIVLELYHSSTACTLTKSGYSLIQKIIKCKKKGVPIFGYPGINAFEDIYRTTKELQEAGLGMLKKMTPESAIVKLMWLIANYPNEIETKMQENISYEICE